MRNLIAKKDEVINAHRTFTFSDRWCFESEDVVVRPDFYLGVLDIYVLALQNGWI